MKKHMKLATLFLTMAMALSLAVAEAAPGARSPAFTSAPPT